MSIPKIVCKDYIICMHHSQTVETTSVYQLTNEWKNEKMNYSILISWNINEHIKKWTTDKQHGWIWEVLCKSKGAWHERLYTELVHMCDILDVTKQER